MEIVTRKILINERSVYVNILWKICESTVFTIRIFDKDKTWTGSFTNDIAKKYKDRLKVEKIEDYLKEVKHCLSIEDPVYKYEFNVENIENKATFSWKKIFQGSTAVIVHGSLEVGHTDESKDTLIDSLLEENAKLKVNLRNCINENNKTNCELENYRDKLENLVNMKSSLEDTLYSKFVLLLNTKKKRIQVLEDALNKIENDKVMLPL